MKKDDYDDYLGGHVHEVEPAAVRDPALNPNGASTSRLGAA